MGRRPDEPRVRLPARTGSSCQPKNLPAVGCPTPPGPPPACLARLTTRWISTSSAAQSRAGQRCQVGIRRHRQLTKRTDADNNAMAYQYDNLNRLTRITYRNAQTSLFTYDDRGRALSFVLDPVGLFGLAAQSV